MSDTELLSLGQALKGSLAGTSAHRMLINAKTALKEGDSMAAIIMAHCAIESLLRRCAFELEREGKLRRPPDLKTDLEKMGLYEYLKTACAEFFIPSERHDLLDCNHARNAAYHKSIPQDLGVVARLVELTDGLGRRLGLWTEDKVETPTVEARVPEFEPDLRVPGGDSGGLSAKDAILRVLADRGEMDASSLYDEAQKYYRGDRRALMAARWRLETEDDVIWFVQSRGVYKLRSGTKTELEADQKHTGRLTGRLALLTALDENGDLPASELYDAAEEMCDCTRKSLTGILSTLVTEGLVLYSSTRDTHKLSREGRQELEDLVG